MKRLILHGLLSFLVIGHAQASDFIVSLVDGAAWTAIGAVATAGGLRLGAEIGERLSRRFNYTRSSVLNIINTDQVVTGLALWGTVYAAKKLLTKDTTASTLGLVAGLASVPTMLFYALLMRDYVPEEAQQVATPAQVEQLIATLTPDDVRAMINMNSNPVMALGLYMRLSEEQRGWVEPEVVTAIQQHFQQVSFAMMH